MPLKFSAPHPVTALLLVLASAAQPVGAQGTVSPEHGAELREVKHPVTGLMLALENPAAVRVGMPSVRVRGRNAGPVVPAATVRTLAERFGLAGADSDLLFKRSDTDRAADGP